MSKKAWGGRFDEEPNALAARFSASVDVDSRLAEEDIQGSIAHANMLASIGVLTGADVKKITEGLAQILDEVRAGTMTWDASREDVHMNIEARLTERIGDAGARLHTGRSRNDQVATDMRLWTRAACEKTARHVDELIAVLIVRAHQTRHHLMPGYTHMQRAQPIRLPHHLLAWCEMLERDRGRLDDAQKRMNESPLGSGALATTTFPLDRQETAKALGFARPLRNSLDAVSDRDFLVEALAALANCAVHLSRIGEELVLWSSQEFGFVQMSDAFTTGSSMMPQKKNPDMAELVRGKSARVIGDLVTMLVLLKGLPLAYNRDLQEDKRPVFDAFDTVDDSLQILSGALATANFNKERMRAALRDGFLEATDLADYLAARGVPFREAHHVAGRLVRLAVETGRTLPELSLVELKKEHAMFEGDVSKLFDPEVLVDLRDVEGGPAWSRVQEALTDSMKRLRSRGTEAEKAAAKFGVVLT
ncbi:MAG: argininosuccinate lyase [Sandaracinaceae bacterium]|nr:argininosuccinate lyase [Sandaracinaceae bacterium]